MWRGNRSVNNINTPCSFFFFFTFFLNSCVSHQGKVMNFLKKGDLDCMDKIAVNDAVNFVRVSLLLLLHLVLFLAVLFIVMWSGVYITTPAWLGQKSIWGGKIMIVQFLKGYFLLLRFTTIVS